MSDVLTITAVREAGIDLYQPDVERIELEFRNNEGRVERLRVPKMEWAGVTPGELLHLRRTDIQPDGSVKEVYVWRPQS